MVATGRRVTAIAVGDAAGVMARPIATAGDEAGLVRGLGHLVVGHLAGSEATQVPRGRIEPGTGARLALAATMVPWSGRL